MMAHLDTNWKNCVNNNDKAVPVLLDRPEVSEKRRAVLRADGRCTAQMGC
jgi:hypothetical protein